MSEDLYTSNKRVAELEEQLQVANVRLARLESLQESYHALHRQWADLATENDRLRVMLDAVLPEKTTFYVIEPERE